MRYAIAGSSAGKTQPPAHGSARLAIASESPHIVFRQAMTSPILASTPRKARVPRHFGGFDHQPDNKVELDRKPGAALQHGAR